MANFNLKSFRSAYELKQLELADILNMTQSNLSRFETNGIDLSNEQFNILYDKYGREEVDAYRISGASNEFFTFPCAEGDQSKELLNIVRQQSETLNRVLEKQSNTNERLLTLLEKLSLR